MNDLRNVETLLSDAIELLEENGFPLAAESLRDNLHAIRRAPTAGARRRRVFQLRDLFDGMGGTLDVSFWSSSVDAGAIRFRRPERRRVNHERYRRTLESIQEVLAACAHDESDEARRLPAEMPRVA